MAYPGAVVVIVAFLLGVFCTAGFSDKFNDSVASGFIAGLSLAAAVALCIMAAIYLHA